MGAESRSRLSKQRRATRWAKSRKIYTGTDACEWVSISHFYGHHDRRREAAKRDLCLCGIEWRSRASKDYKRSAGSWHPWANLRLSDHGERKPNELWLDWRIAAGSRYQSNNGPD